MPDLHFQVEEAQPNPGAAVPMLHFRLRVKETTATPIHSIVLRCQVRIQPARRRYAPQEQERLRDLFGTPERWGQTVRDMLWTPVMAVVPAFEGETVIDLPVPCSYDFSLAATCYFDALEEGEIPLSFLFSGTIFHASPEAGLQVALIPWEKESSFRLGVDVWRKLMDLYYPSSAWLVLRKDIFDRLSQYKRDRGLPTLEQAVEELLSAREEVTS